MTEREVYKKTYNIFTGRCAICGSNEIQMHHIRYGGLYGGRKTYIGNVIPLCAEHHRLVHTNKKYYMSRLIEIIEKKLKKGD